MDEEKFILHGPTSPYEPAKGGLGFEIFRSLKLHKDKIAEHYIDSEESSTYDDLLVNSRRLALHLLSKKLKKEDSVCLCSHSQINSVLPFFASKFIDVSYSTIEPSMPENDLVYLFGYINPKVLFVAENVEEKIERCLKEANIDCDIIIFGKSKKYVSLDDLLGSTPGEEEFTPVVVEDVMETAVIFFSSGTTGKPKGICCNHYSMLAQSVNVALLTGTRGTINLSNYSYDLGLTTNKGQGNNLMFSPLYWVSGVITVLLTVILGMKRTIGARFDGETAWKGIKKYKPSATFIPPGQVVDLYLRMDKSLGKSQPNDFMDVFLTGGGPVKSLHLTYINEMFPKAVSVQIMGMTENTSTLSTFNVNDPREVELQKKYPGSCGKVCYGTSCKIVDVDTECICAFNQQGELRIKSKYLMNGYYKMDSNSAFDSDGWFKTGDLAFINEEKCLFIVDRLKDILLYKVYNIRPSVIEEILAQHPAVYESFVLGLPHLEDNEHPMGVVVVKDEHKNKVTSEEITEFVNERVPSDRYKIRAGIKFVDEMIKTVTGKIKRLEMKHLIIEGKL